MPGLTVQAFVADPVIGQGHAVYLVLLVHVTVRVELVDTVEGRLHLPARQSQSQSHTAAH